jgi:hypothetical protein
MKLNKTYKIVNFFNKVGSGKSLHSYDEFTDVIYEESPIGKRIEKCEKRLNEIIIILKN